MQTGTRQREEDSDQSRLVVQALRVLSSRPVSEEVEASGEREAADERQHEEEREVHPRSAQRPEVGVSDRSRIRLRTSRSRLNDWVLLRSSIETDS